MIMRKKICIILLSLSVFTIGSAQDFNLVAGFNNNQVSWDEIPSSWLVSLPDQGISAGRIKSINDSTFVYLHNRQDNSGTQIFSRVVMQTIQSDGSVNLEPIFSSTSPYGFSDIITDVVVHNSSIYVIGNSRVGVNQLYGTFVRKFLYNNGSITTDLTFGSNGLWDSQDVPTDFQFALGTIESNTLVLYGQTSWPIKDIGRVGILMNGQGHSFSFIVTNPAQHFSFIGDVLTIGSDTYLADNGYVIEPGGDYTSQTRIVKISMGSLATSFGNNGLFYPNWSNLTANLNSSFVNKLLATSDGNILAVGNRSYFNTTMGAWFSQGRVSKLSTNGAFVSGFGSSGTFNIDSEFGRSEFKGVTEKNGAYFVTGYSGPASFTQGTGLIFQVNSTGILNTTLGTNGFIRLNPNNVSDILSISERSNGHWVLNVLSSNTDQQIGLGAYTLGSATASVTEFNNIQLSVYPNPASSTIRIDLIQSSPVTIYNTLGEIVIEASDSMSHAVDVSHLQSGIYLIRAGETIQRFIKQ
jgi:hypothetical protein